MTVAEDDAFDCGPANALLDVAAQQFAGQPYDAGGVRTARGRVDGALLAVLLEDDYLSAPPPKSTGEERYHVEYLATALSRVPAPDVDDLLATLAEASAAAVAADIGRLGVTRVWASGGGMRNAGVVTAPATGPAWWARRWRARTSSACRSMTRRPTPSRCWAG